MTSESVGGEFEADVEAGFEESGTAGADNGSMDTDAVAIINARKVTGSVAIS